ncbi:CBN-SRX-133 protein [Caenorhabditis brenneri]|uniref:CBN-SRX-133 protein n=1 Tax=Caenorhabditis brenneri TaxID=135651 RepID=G0MRQ4_CAEBE|nr:CBN-SRX-133 protein [Caenorhabditis brenneri]
MLLHHLVTCVLFLVSLLGFIVNAFFFLKLTALQKTLNSFQKLCFVKGISNALICASIILWAVPLSAFSAKTENVWRSWNIGISELTASGGYIFGPLCQILMAANRVIVLYCPLFRMRMERVPSTNISIFVCVLVSLYCSIAGMQGPCVLIYHPETLAWSPELSTCIDSMDGLQLATIIILTFIAILFNVLAVFKLIYDKVSGITDTQKSRRRKRWLAMFIQNVIQDALHVIDMINYSVLDKLVEGEGFHFIFMSLSFALIYVLDGIVMLRFHVYTQQRAVERKNWMFVVAQFSPRQT